MQPFFQFRTAEFTDHCHTQLHQEAGLLHAQSTWQGPHGQLAFTDYFLPGFQLTTMRGELAEPLRLELAVDRPWTAMHYQLDGQLDSKSCARRPLRIGHGQQNVMGDETTTNHYTFQGQHYNGFTAHVEPAFFAQLVAGNEDWLPAHQGRLGQAEPFVLLPPGAVISPTQRAIIQQIADCPYSGPLRKLFLEARFLDLFIEQQTQLARPRATPAASRDRDILHAIRDFLDVHYAEPPSLLQLARQFGTNDFKLKKGFRELFGTTVFGYVAERRLTVAYQLLTLTDQPVLEVAEAVGFASPAHFTTVFRQRFGHTPTQVRGSRTPLAAATW